MTSTQAEALPDFPRLAQHATPEQVEAVVEYLVTLPLTELRNRQEIHAAQVARAKDQRRSDIAQSELIKFDMTTDAISRQTFGHPMAGLHSDIGGGA